MRFENKFEISENELNNIRTFLSAKGFIEKFKGRIVNSIYYDNLEFRNFIESEEGYSLRKKNRLRFYNDDNINSILESKNKVAELGSKDFKEISKFKKSELTNLIYINNKNQISKIKIPKSIEAIKLPVILIQYMRHYFESKVLDLRITFDQNIIFKKLIRNNNEYKTGPAYRSDIGVLEIKYNRETSLNLDFVECLSNKFNLILSRHSKYCKGIQHVY